MIVYGRVTHYIFQSEDKSYYILAITKHGGGKMVATYAGTEPPKPLKTVEYEFRGELYNHPKYGKQFKIESFERSKVKNQMSESRSLRGISIDAKKHLNDL